MGFPRGFGYKVKMTVVKLSFSEKVFLSNGVIAKNYKMYWGLQYALYQIKVFSLFSNITNFTKHLTFFCIKYLIRLP